MDKFYDHFKFGLEFEMETPPNSLNLDSTYGNMRVVRDGSINRVAGGHCFEIICAEPLTTKDEETAFLNTMKSLIPVFQSQSGEEVFAYHNLSCGTHYHWSFKNHKDAMLWVYDTIDFEKFFYTEYVKEFRTEKFLSRINTNFCKAPTLSDAAKGAETKPHEVRASLNKLTMAGFAQEYAKTSRYRWLNMQSVVEGTGAEIRIFPFLQTHAGVNQVTKFMKRILLEFYLNPSTQEKIKLMEFYSANIEGKPLKFHLLNEMKRLAYEILVTKTVNDTSLAMLSGELRILLARWVKKQPNLIKQEKAS